MTPGTGRRGTLREDIARILAQFRAENGWVRGARWDPSQGTYVRPTTESNRSQRVIDYGE